MSLQLPDESRAWQQYQLDAPARENLNNVLLTLLTFDEDGHITVIGNAFIVYAHEHGALCLTAAHCFDEIRKIQATRAARAHPTFPADFQEARTLYLKTERVRAVCILQGKLVDCAVSKLCYIDGYDVAAFSAHSSESDPIFNDRLALDTDVPQIGDEIRFLSHTLSVRPESNGGVEVSRAPIALSGTVTGVTFGPARMRTSFVIETTIPLLPGWSGAPLFSPVNEGEPIAVCGVASYDLSGPDAREDFRIPGHSTAAMVWPAMCLGFEMNVQDQGKASTLLGTLLEQGFLDDRSRFTKLSTYRSDSAIQIKYERTDGRPPAKFVLQTRNFNES